jgi:hypothetical protein
MRRQLLIPSLFVAFAAWSVRPGAAPQPALEPFARGVVSTDSGESFASLSPDGRELYFTAHRSDWSRHRIMVSRFDGTRWSAPAPLPFSGTYNDREPKLTPDGRRLFFSSNRPTGADTARRRDLDLWYVDRDAAGRWGTPQHLDAPINTDAQEFCPVVAGNGTLYFVSTRAGGITSRGSRTHNVWRAAFVGGRYAAPENIGAAVNQGWETNVYVTPDERVMLVSRDGAPDSFGGDDLYVSERKDGAWTTARHLPAPINSAEYDYGPLISPDGRWLFFTSHRAGTGDLYRVDIALLGLTTRPTPRSQL